LIVVIDYLNYAIKLSSSIDLSKSDWMVAKWWQSWLVFIGSFLILFALQNEEEHLNPHQPISKPLVKTTEVPPLFLKEFAHLAQQQTQFKFVMYFRMINVWSKV
jgi:hypothetical protein